MQCVQEDGNALIIHDGGGQQHEPRHGDDHNASSLQLAHEPVGGALARQGHDEAHGKD